MKPSFSYALAFILIQAATFTSTASAQRFELVEPSGIVTGRIEIARGRLLVYDSTGDRLYFSRQPRYDSYDGRSVGYFNIDLNRALRFPRCGSGWMQTADFDHAFPRYENTRRTVRPAGAFRGHRQGHFASPWAPTFNNPGFAGPGYGTPGYEPPAYGPPAGFQPGYGYGTSFGTPGFGGPNYGGYSTPYASGYRSPRLQPQSVLIESETIPNPPLPPARLNLRNDGRREVQVAIVDAKNVSGSRSLRIPPGASKIVDLERDSGAQRVAHYRVVSPYGESTTQEIVTDVPPPIRYEVVVHEWAMQSIAIDRTGKSPNPIEDINFQGRGLGRFPLPPGPELQSGTIDVVRAARSQGNQGSVGPLVPSDRQPSDNASQLERAIIEAQRAAQRAPR
jgi:hypothetical protein